MMNIDQQLKTLSQQRCPHEVDVVDDVMARVRQLPTPRRRTIGVVWRSAALTAVAAAVALLIVNVANTRSYNDDQIGSMLSSVYDCESYFSVESAATESLGYLYDDYGYDNTTQNI